MKIPVLTKPCPGPKYPQGADEPCGKQIMHWNEQCVWCAQEEHNRRKKTEKAMEPFVVAVVDEHLNLRRRDE